MVVIQKRIKGNNNKGMIMIKMSQSIYAFYHMNYFQLAIFKRGQ